MINYFKLATFFVRLAALYATSLGVLTLAFIAFAYARGGQQALGPQPLERFWVSVAYFAGAGLLVALASPIARLLAKGLD